MNTPIERGLRIAADLATVMQFLRGAAYVGVVAGLFYIIPMVDRAVTVLENLDARTERIVQGAAPVARELVGAGIDTIRAIDGRSIGKSLSDKIKEKLK